MLAKFTGKLIFLGLTALILLLCASVFFFRIVTYETLVNTVLNRAGRTDLFAVVTQNYFPIEKFRLLSTLSYFLAPLAAMTFFCFIKYRQRIIATFQRLTGKLFRHMHHFFVSLYNNSATVNRLLLISLLLILARSIWYASLFYIQHDEAWNYNFFLHKNIISTFFVYNNYPFHNIVSWALLQLLPVSTFVLRLPSVFSGLMACAIVFVSVKKIFKSEWTALCAMALFACLPISVSYMLYARGVMLEMISALLVWYLLYPYLQQKISNAKIIFLALLNALGVWCMLSHVYFIMVSGIAAAVFLLLQHDKQYRFILLYPLLSVTFSLLLLSSMIAGTGLSPGLNAGMSDASYLTLHYLPFHCYSDFATGSRFGFYLLGGLNIFLLFYKNAKPYRLLLILNMILIASPLAIKLLSGAYPPERALAFLFLIMVSTFGITASVFAISRKWLVFFTSVACLILSIVVHDHDKLNWSKEKDAEVFRLAGILKSNGLKEIYNESKEFVYFIPGVQYYFLCDKKQIGYRTSIPGSNRFASQMPLNMDCIVRAAPSESGILIYRLDSMFVYRLK